MASLTVLKFDTPDGAAEMLAKLQDLEKQQLLQIQDGAIVSWPTGAKAPKTKQLHNLAAAGALDGAFWGMLFGLIFFVPFFGLAIGAAMGALAGHFADYGIDDKMINDMRSKITEGTSALFLLTNNAVVDKIADAIKGMKFEVISTSLSKEEEDKLRAAFATD